MTKPMKPRSLIIIFGVAVILFIAVMIGRAKLNATPGGLVQEAIRNSLNHSEAGTTTVSLLATAWEETINLTNDPAESLTGQFNGFQMGTDSSKRIHVGFRDNHLNVKTEEIYYKRYNGTAWEPAKKLSDISALASLGALEKLDVSGPALAVSPAGDVHAVWNFAVVNSVFGNKIIKPRKTYYQRSTNGGTTFTAPVLVGEGGDGFGGATVCYGSKKSLLTTQKIVNVITTGDGNQALYAYYSTNNGQTFTKSPITTYQSAKEAPVCAIDSNGSVYVVWQDDRDGVVVDGLKRRDVHFSRSLDGGKTWGPAKNLTNTPGAGSSDASIALGTGSKVHVVYHDDKNDGNTSWEVYYIQSPDKGATWKQTQKLTATTPTEFPNIDLPTIAVTADGKVHIAWHDRRNGGYPQIFYKKGDGETWEPEILLSDGSTNQSGNSPSIVVNRDGSSVHVLWSGRVISSGPNGPVLSSKPDILYRKTK